MPQELAGIDQMDLGVWQSNCLEEIKAGWFVNPAWVRHDFANINRGSGQKKSGKQRRRVEKSLLHQVLHPAKFKAQHESTRSPAKDTAAVPGNGDVMMKDIDNTCPNTASTSRQDMNEEQRMPDATVKDADISTLKVVDHGS